jgi:hypothetical protein
LGCQVGSRKFTFALEIVRFFETLLGVFRCHKILEFLKSKSIRNLLRFIFSTLCMRINLSDPKVRMVFGIAKCLLEYRVFFFDFKMKPLPSVFFFFHKKAAGCQGQRSLSVASIVQTSFKINLWGQLATLISSTLHFNSPFSNFLEL